MRRLLALLILSSTAFATTTVTGHIQNLGTNGISNGAFVRFWLRGCGGNQPRIGGTAVIAPSQGGVFYFDLPAGASGVISGTIYSTRDSTGLLGGDIECGGSTTAVWYGMQIFQAGKGGPEVAIVAKNTATIDISNVTPITTNPVIVAPTGDSTYARLDGGNQPFTGSVTPSGTGTLNLGASGNRWNGFFAALNISGTVTGGTFVSSTLTSPTITNPTTTGTDSGAETLSNKSLPTATFPEQTAPSAASSKSICYADSSFHALECSYNNASFYPQTQTVAQGTATLTTTPITSGTCATTVTASATGTFTQDTIVYSYATFPTPANDGVLILSYWPTSGHVNFALCNPTAGSITPSGLQINWKVVR